MGAARARRPARRDLVPLARGPPRQAVPRRSRPRVHLPARAADLRLRPRTRGRAADPPRRGPHSRRDRRQSQVQVGAPARRPQARRRQRLTPPAATQSGRAEAPHRRRVRQSPRPAAPRRVSGPARGRATAAPAEPLTRPSTGRRPLATSIGIRARAFVRSLPDHPVLDRLIRGRAWIPLLGVMLAGIVAMQVEVLKLGASMGRSLEANSTLSAQNATLRESVASLADDQRIEQLAASMGMVMPPPSAVGFLSPHGRRRRSEGRREHPPARPGVVRLPDIGQRRGGHTIQPGGLGQLGPAGIERGEYAEHDVERSDVEHSDVQHSDVEHDVEHADRRDHRHRHHGERRDDAQPRPTRPRLPRRRPPPRRPTRPRSPRRAPAPPPPTAPPPPAPHPTAPPDRAALRSLGHGVRPRAPSRSRPARRPPRAAESPLHDGGTGPPDRDPVPGVPGAAGDCGGPRHLPGVVPSRFPAARGRHPAGQQRRAPRAAGHDHRPQRRPAGDQPGRRRRRRRPVPDQEPGQGLAPARAAVGQDADGRAGA